MRRVLFSSIIFLFSLLSLSAVFALPARAVNDLGGGGGSTKVEGVPQYVCAMSSAYATNPPSCVSAVKVMNKTSGDVFFDKSVLTIFAGTICRGLGCTLSSSGQVSIGPSSNNKSVAYAISGFAGTLINGSAYMAGTQVASSREYIADLIQTIQNPLGAKPAYAQGIGFSSLNPVLAIWRLFRNIAYFFFVIIFLIIGFLIMFRSSLGGKAAITVQQALPKIVISLLLVTFSYAIAGLMIDVMYLSMYLVIGIFSPLFPNGIGGNSLTQIAFEQNIVQNMFGFIGNGVVGSISGAMGNIVVGALGLVEQNFGGYVVQGGANILFTLILGVAILVQIFRVFFALLQAYFGIFMSVIFSPLQLLIGAIPGQDTFKKWIMGLFENLLVFPVIIAMIFIAYYFSVGDGGIKAINGNNENLGFSAPQLTSNQSSDGFRIYQSLIALAAIMAMPEVLKIAKGLMKGQVDVNMGDLAKNFQKGWTGGEVIPGLGFTKIGARSLMPDRIANAVPFGFGDAVPFRTSGKETSIERLLLGSREERRKEVDYQRQAALFGKTVRIRQGGLAGSIMNARGAERAAEEQRGGGAGSEKI